MEPYPFLEDLPIKHSNFHQFSMSVLEYQSLILHSSTHATVGLVCEPQWMVAKSQSPVGSYIENSYETLQVMVL